MSPTDLPRLRYSSFDTWKKLSSDTRSVILGAANIDRVFVIANGQSINDGVNTLARCIEQGTMFPELIAVEGANDEIILVEGHTGATAHVYAKASRPLAILVGRSREMSRWAFY